MVKPWMAGALAVLLVVAIIYFTFQPRPVPEGVTPSLRAAAVETGSRAVACGDLEGRDYNQECRGRLLVWKHCEQNRERELSVDCSKLQRAGEEGYCEPFGTLPDGSTGPTCAYRPPGAATPTLDAEAEVEITATPPAARVLAGPGYCGDGVCGASESCSSCALDCGCASGQRCDSDVGVCVRA